MAENLETVHRGWKLHYDNIEHSLRHAYYQGWDLNPAQLPIRYAAVYHFFLESLHDASVRLNAFINKAAQATLEEEKRSSEQLRRQVTATKKDLDKAKADLATANQTIDQLKAGQPGALPSPVPPTQAAPGQQQQPPPPPPPGGSTYLP